MCLFLAEMPLDALVKQYAGAYADGFQWPQPSPHSDVDDLEETEGSFIIKNHCHGLCFCFLFFLKMDVTPKRYIYCFAEMECLAHSPPEAVLIDSLLSMDQYRSTDKTTSSDSGGKTGKDIAEVAAATELILPKGSFRTTSSVRRILKLIYMYLEEEEKKKKQHFSNF